jgi:large subunit ribosomal protein L25
MPDITLVAEPGRPTGSPASRRLRSSGRIPAVLYGHGSEAQSLSVDGRALRQALSGQAGLNQLLSLKVGSETHLAMARSLQRHPVRHTVIHVDFQIVRRDEVLSAEVPIVLAGEAKAVEQENGLVEQLLNALTVNATPDRIPGHIEVDISELTIGEGIRVSSLNLPSGVTTDVDPDELVVLASVTRAAAAGPEEEAEGEGAEPGAGEGAEGARAGQDASGRAASGEGSSSEVG